MSASGTTHDAKPPSNIEQPRSLGCPGGNRCPGRRNHDKSGIPSAAADVVFPKKIVVIHRQDAAIGILHRLGITDVPVREIIPDLEFSLGIPGLAFVAAEGSANAARLGMDVLC